MRLALFPDDEELWFALFGRGGVVSGVSDRPLPGLLRLTGDANDKRLELGT